MSESMRMQSQLTADLEVYRAKGELIALRAENARLREALRFYADPQTYGIHGGSMKRILEDSGDMAKAALTPAAGGTRHG